MTTYNTGNPVPSTAIKDLYDNAENLDSAINGSDLTWADRLGVVRESWAGFKTAFDQFLVNGSVLTYTTYADAAAATIDLNKTVQVIGDSGTHTDPVSAATVSNSGTYVKVSAGLKWLRADLLLSKAGLQQIGMSYETVGRPTSSTPVAGSTNTTQCVIFNEPIAANAQLALLRCYVSQASRVAIASFTKDGATFTRTGEIVVQLVSGVNEIGLGSLPELFVAAGNYVGYSCPDMQVVSATADSGGIWSGNYGTTVTDTDGVVNTTAQPQIGLSFSEIPQDEYLFGRFASTRNLLTDAGRGVGFRIGKGLPFATTTPAANPDRTFVIGTAALYDAVLRSIRLYSLGAGTISVKVFDKSTNLFTQSGDDFEIGVVAGDQTLSITDIFRIKAGQYIGFHATSGILCNVSDAENYIGYYDNQAAGGGNSSSFTDASIANSLALQIGFHFTAVDPAALIGLALNGMKEIGERIGTNFTVGKTRTPTTGSANPARTWAVGTPASKGGVLKTVRAYALASGSVSLKVFNKSGDTFTQVGDDCVVDVTAGSNTVAMTDLLKVQSGQYVGFYAPPGILCNVSDSENAIGYYDSGTALANVNSFTDTTFASSVALQIGFDFISIEDGSSSEVISDSILSLAEQVNSGQASFVETTGYILVWAIGQSNTSGRALSLSSKSFTEGQAYKYVRSSESLELLADPTGNDATAAAGRGSWGPAFADAIRRLSNGALGTIIVNSAEGGTALSPGWQSGGTYWNQAVTDLDTALAAVAAAKLPIVGACTYMQQGESDGDNGTSTSDYESLFANLKTLVDAKVGSKVPFLMTRIGTKNTGDTTAYAAIRDAQNVIANTVNGVHLVHTGTKYFMERGLMMDTFHYVIDGYDEIGVTVGNAAFGLALGARPLGFDD